MTEMKKSLQRKYFEHEKFVLKVVGISFSNDESRLYKVYTFINLFFIHICFPIISSGDLFKHEFEVVADSYAYGLGAVVGAGIVPVVYANRVKLGKLIETLEREPFNANANRGGEVEAKLLGEWGSFCNKQRLIIYIALVVTLTPQILTSLITRITSSDYHDWKFGFGPLTVLNVTYSPNYEISWMYQTISVVYIAYSTSTCILLLSGILAFISIQFRILQNNLRNIIDIASRKGMKNGSISNNACNSEIPWTHLHEALKEAIHFHKSILNVGAEIEKTFSMSMLWLYSSILPVLCFEVFRATQIPINDPRLMRLFLEWSCAAFLPFMICYCGEQVAHQSLQVGEAAYEAQFVGTDVRFQKELAIIIRRSQRMMRLKAGKVIEISMATFAGIIRGSYSAFMMLRNTNMED